MHNIAELQWPFSLRKNIEMLCDIREKSDITCTAYTLKNK